MIIALVVAVAENRVIGKDGDLPWHIPGDLKLFKQTTLGKPIVMGRKTWESLGRPLPGRPNIVITRDAAFQAEGAHVVHDLDQAFAVAGDLAVNLETEEVMIIGGAEIYKLAFPMADRLYLTEVALSPDGDATFPDFDMSQWREVSRSPFPAEGDSPSYTLVVYDRADA